MMMLGLSFILILTTSYACKCAFPNVPQAFKQSEAVFSGKVIKITRKQSEGYDYLLFEVDNTCIGVNQLQVIVKTQWSTCQYDFKPGENYLVYAHKFQSNDLETNLCSRTINLASENEDLTVIGHGEMPKQKVNLEGEIRGTTLSL
jgi:hypothetical protein